MLVHIPLQYFALIVFVVMYCFAFIVHKVHRAIVLRHVQKIQRNQLCHRRKHPFIIVKNATLKN